MAIFQMDPISQFPVSFLLSSFLQEQKTDAYWSMQYE